MKILSLFRPVLIAAALLACATQAQQLPEPLIFQIQHLAKVYADAYAVEDKEGRMIQRLSPGPDGERVLAVFSVKGFRSGPRYMQYLAMFVESPTEKSDEKHYRLVDVMPIGGRMWRDVVDLDAKVMQGGKAGDLTIELPVVENTREADSSSIRVMTMVQVLLKDGRLVEVGKRPNETAKHPKADSPSAQKAPVPSKR